jgi:hypothetical protein
MDGQNRGCSLTLQERGRQRRPGSLLQDLRIGLTAQEHHPERRHDDQQHDRSDQHAASSGRWHLAADVGPDFEHPAPPEVRYSKEPLTPRTSSTDIGDGQSQHFINGLAAQKLQHLLVDVDELIVNLLRPAALRRCRPR